MASHTQNNREYFDSMAARYHSEPWIQQGVALLAKGINDHLDWIGVDLSKRSNDQGSHERSIRLLDFGCGPGIISQVLGPYVSQVRGIDVSDNMVEEYNKASSSLGKGSDFMHAVQGDLLQAAGPEEKLNSSDLFNFDLAVVSLALHHFEDSDLALKRIAERLKKGSGVLLVIDFLDESRPGAADLDQPIFQRGQKVLTAEETEKFNALPAAQRQRIEEMLKKSAPTIKQPAFSEAQMKELYSKNGFEKDFEFIVLEGKFERMGLFGTKLFMSKARLS